MRKGMARLCISLVLVMVCMTFSVAASEVGFSDTEGHYARPAVETWAEYGILKGYPDGFFRPDGTITRAEMATVLNRLMGYQTVAENTFSDLPVNKWYTDPILRLTAEGIFQGNSDGTMAPDAPITRQEAFATLARVLGLEESGEATNFTDDDTISNWARGYVSAL